MYTDKVRDESVKHLRKRDKDIDKYLFGDDNELDQSELIKGFDISKTRDKK
jgi:hypothetical protein